MPADPSRATPVAQPLARLLEHCAEAVAAVRSGRSLTEALERCPAAARAGSQALAFEVMRGLGRAQALATLLVARQPPPWVEALLLCALALGARDSRAGYAPHTLVNQAVDAAKRRAPAQAGLVNAVLRRALREAEALDASLAGQDTVRWNHPAWWIAQLRQDWPADWPALLDAAQAAPPMTLRVNLRRGSVADYAQRLAEAGLSARTLGPETPQALQLDTPQPVERLPGWAEGAVSVQDASAQRAAHLLLDGAGLPPGARVLDACAAPGGKTAHLLERAELDLLALDSDAHRLRKVDQGLARLGLRARTVAGDAGRPADWWDGRPFDAILLDAPCSAAGIVRRHPDVRWLRRPSDLPALAQAQARLLDALWPLLAPGGRLLFATCSIFRAEGQTQIDAFLQRTPGARLRPSPGHLLPLAHNGAEAAGLPVAEGGAPGDGFFYALLTRAEGADGPA